MSDDIRGGCGDMPLELRGEFTGYNNGPTMQVGLWIANDGEYNATACRVALNGPSILRGHLTGVLNRAVASSRVSVTSRTAALLTYRAVMESEGGMESIDWAQICYALVGDEPDYDDLRAARDEIFPMYHLDDPDVYRVARRRREERARTIALGEQL